MADSKQNPDRKAQNNPLHALISERLNGLPVPVLEVEQVSGAYALLGCNRSATRLLSTDSPPVVGECPSLLVSTPSTLRSAMAQSLSEQSAVSVVTTLLHSPTIPLAIEITPITEDRLLLTLGRNSGRASISASLGAFADSLPLGVVLLSPSGTILFANHFARQRLGAGEAVPGQSLFPLLSSATTGVVQSLLHEAMAQGDAVSVEVAVGEGYMRLCVHPLVEYPVTSKQAVLTLEDISELRKSKEERDVSLNTVQALFDYSPFALFTQDKEHRFLSINAAVREWLGVTAEQIIGKRLWDIYPETQASRVVENGLIMETGIPYSREYTFVFHGEPRHFLGTKFPLRDSEGQICAVGGVGVDITELKKMERRQQQVEKHLNRAQQFAGVGSFEYVFPENDVFWSEQQYHLFGIPVEEPPPSFSLLEEYVHESDRGAFRDCLQAARESGGPFDCTVRTSRRDGRLRYFRLQGEWECVGDVEGISGICTDVTRLRNVERRALQRHTMDPLEEFTVGVAHDFKNLLHIIGLNMETVMENAGAKGSLLHPLSRGLACVRQARDMVSELLLFCRGGEEPACLRDPISCVQEVISFLQTALPSEIRLHTSLTPCGKVFCGERELQQIVCNLSFNAADAMPDGGDVHIILSAGSDDFTPPGELIPLTESPCLQLEVRDTGEGMPEHVCKRIFEPFYTTKAAGKGTGMGLAVVRSLVSGMGGRIRCHSVEGTGTSFIVTLPIAEFEKAEEQVEKSVCVEDGSDKPRILYIDDRAELHVLIGDSLSDDGMEVTSLSTPEKALDLLEKDSCFDLLLTDYHMKGMNGVELARQVATRWPKIPVVLCTGESKDIAVHSWVNSHDGVLLPKPFTLAQLKTVVRSALGSR